ncbi:cupin domain-containing protein [Abyssalbus ytuae]|uniref:Cupin domain-containing protein n=1 Tax=Abyssalbus ytuae TaxID=2926907 RepID=A0A9E6ZRA8_9FLAO|nr:cupin domain-containing protein [Abyssalbus ytuae]UOB16453.1 cupin domain-containing protein [Abyssalbus ytuae]
MKTSLLILINLVVFISYSQNRVLSGVYTFKDITGTEVLMEGETTHFSPMVFKVETLKNEDDEKLIHHDNREQIIIIKEGKVQVKLEEEIKTVGANSVIFIHPDDNCLIKSETPQLVYYTMLYQSKKPVDLERGTAAGGSFIVDFDKLEYNQHDKGGIRNYFHTKTAMCPYYEMHVTNLNAGIKSHEPHTHHAAEIVIMLDGTTEMEIGDKIFKGNKGDVYFLASNVPHAIKNTGNEQCMYVAFQWD